MVAPGQSVREALDTTDLRVRAACGGTGSCGACVVKLLSGEVTPPTVAEHTKLTSAERARGRRLACQLRLRGDAEILLDQPAPPSQWKSIPAAELVPWGGGSPELTTHIYGVAVDLGTTQIRVALWDRKRGLRIAARRGPNPQGAFGADVLNRLGAAHTSLDRGRELAALARTAIVQAVRDMLAREIGEVTSMLGEIGRLVVVGNTAMLALLTGRGADALMDPDNWQRSIDCRPLDPEAWRADWYMPHVEIVMPPPVAGFVGSDLPADLLATGLINDPAGSMLLDVGTNSEIALWDGVSLHVTSVPGGPAFEGGGISRGMPAEPGAIRGVRRRDDDGFDCDVIGGGEPRGFCGSGIVDAVAVLLTAGLLKPSGRFVRPPGGGAFSLQQGNTHTSITGSDVDAFQRAKAATAAATEVLLRRAGMAWSDLRRLCLCGAFGHTLDIDSAWQVGLLPPMARANVELHANATLAGSERVLLSQEGERLFAGPLASPMAVNLSRIEEYDGLYIDHLPLRPIRTE
jgi:uncharacterized 2Fe-2S/4Fe-4S cluster protein (DUF4445 family)